MSPGRVYRQCGACGARIRNTPGGNWVTVRPAVGVGACAHYPLYRKSEKTAVSEKLLEVLTALRDM